MKKINRSLSLIVICSILFASCSSTTMIQSTPSNAKLYIDGEYVGETPYAHRDSKIVGSTMLVKIEKDGYKPLVSNITKDEDINVGAIIGGLFFAVPYLWTMKYKPVHTYELIPILTDNEVKPEIQKNLTNTRSKAEKLRELKQLLDDNIITADEFDKEKAKILETNN